MVVVRKTDEGGEAARRSKPSSTLCSFGSAETGCLRARGILNMGAFFTGGLERVRIFYAKEGGKRSGQALLCTCNKPGRAGPEAKARGEDIQAELRKMNTKKTLKRGEGTGWQAKMKSAK